MAKQSDYLKSPDLLPTSIEKRNIGSLGFVIVWIGMAVVLAAFTLGGAGIQQLPLGMVILATAVGSVLLGILMTLTGDIGVEHGLSFPVYMRAPFGTVGTHIPSVLRGFVAAGWFGVNSYFGALAMNSILYTLTGFDSWELCFGLFVIAQLINAAIGMKAIERFADLAAPIIIVISGWMYITLSDQATSAGKDIWSWIESPATGTVAFTAFIVVVMGNMGFWSALAADMPTISRFIKAPTHNKNWFKRNKNAILGNIVAYPITQMFMVAIGAVSYIALGNSDPIAALQQSTNGIILGILLLMIILAQWSTNTTANLTPAATIFSNIGGPRVPFWLGVIVAGIVGVAIQPWNLFEFINSTLLYIGAVLSGIVGILLADYYFIRKRRLNVQDLYELDGQYQYKNGVNYAGFLAWIIGAIFAFIFMNYSFIVGLIVSGTSYYVLAKYWWFKVYKQKEIENPSDELYLGISVGRSWDIPTQTLPIDVKDTVLEVRQ